MTDVYEPGKNVDEWDEDLTIPERPAWHRYAMCRGMAYTEPDLFFPEQGNNGAARQAMTLCRVCPVQKECAAVGLWELHGIWGGLSERKRRAQRWAIPRDQRTYKPPINYMRTTAACGTPQGYKRHLRKGEDPCPGCRAAHNRYKNPTQERPKGQHNGTR